MSAEECFYWVECFVLLQNLGRVDTRSALPKYKISSGFLVVDGDVGVPNAMQATACMLPRSSIDVMIYLMMFNGIE